MLTIEADSFSVNYAKMRQDMGTLIHEPINETDGQGALTGCLNLITLGAKAYLLHNQIRQQVKDDDTLPQIVRQDPPSLRSNLWMIMIDEAMNPHSQVPRQINDYPVTLYALTRCYLNGMDDIMDSHRPPVTKADFRENQLFSEIQSRLAKEFWQISRQNPLQHHRAKKSLRGYIMARNNWLDEYNLVEQNKDQLSFQQALDYTIMTMGPLTFMLNYSVAVNHDFSGFIEQNLNEALVWFAAAGKLIDDMTDWYKDHRKGELNLFSLAMKESGELDRMVQSTRFFRFCGQKAFVPITFQRLVAPQATSRVMSIIDSYIDKIGDCGYDRLTSSMVGIRHMMWAYALNEGLPQV